MTISTIAPPLAFIAPSDGVTPAVVFSIIESEQHEAKAGITEHPVEIGAPVTDHVRNEPDRITLNGYVTNSPMNEGENGGVFTGVTLDVPKYTPPPLSITAAASAGLSLLSDLLFGTPPTVARLLTFPAPFDNVLEVHNALTAIRYAGALCNIYTSTKAYDSMMIESITYRKDEAGGGSFTVDLKRVNLVTSAVVAAPVPLIKAGNPPAPKGSQVPEELSPAEKKSLAKKAAGAVFDLAANALK